MASITCSASSSLLGYLDTRSESRPMNSILPLLQDKPPKILMSNWGHFFQNHHHPVKNLWLRNWSSPIACINDMERFLCLHSPSSILQVQLFIVFLPEQHLQFIILFSCNGIRVYLLQNFLLFQMHYIFSSIFMTLIGEWHLLNKCNR